MKEETDSFIKPPAATTAAAETTPMNGFAFLDLSAELRDMVYTYVVDNKVTARKVHHPLFAVSKQVRQEALANVFKDSDLTFKINRRKPDAPAPRDASEGPREMELVYALGRRHRVFPVVKTRDLPAYFNCSRYLYFVLTGPDQYDNNVVFLRLIPAPDVHICPDFPGHPGPSYAIELPLIRAFERCLREELAVWVQKAAPAPLYFSPELLLCFTQLLKGFNDVLWKGRKERGVCDDSVEGDD